MTLTAREMVNFSAAGLGDERRVDALSDPAPGALVITPEIDAKIRKALNRYVRSYKRRLYFYHFQLPLLKLSPKLKATGLKDTGRTHVGTTVTTAQLVCR